MDLLLTLSDKRLVQPSLTNTNTSIESVLQEQRVFEPPASFSAEASISSLEAYRAMADAAKADPDSFWGDAARRELHWFEPFIRFWIGAMPPSPAGLRGAPPTCRSTASIGILRALRPTRQR
jgi:acetyl-CoA synthetase